MDSQLAAVLTNGGAALISRANIPERVGKSVEMLPLTDIQDVPMDLSQKSSTSLVPDSQPLCLKLSPSCSNEVKQLYWTESRVQTTAPDTGEDNTDTLEIVAEVTGVHEPLLPNTDSVNTPCKDSLTSDFTACKSEQRGITFGCGSNDLPDYPAANLVTVKEEIEEVFIGELEGYSEDSSDSPVALDEINTEDEDTAGDGANGTDTQSAVVTGANRDKVSVDTITPMKTELEGTAADSCLLTTQDTSGAEKQTTELDGNITASTVKETRVDKRAQINSGSSSGNSKLPNTGPSEREAKEKSGWKRRKDRSSLPVVPTYSISTRSQRRRELEREAKGENADLSKERKPEEKLQSPPSATVYQGQFEPNRKMGEGADAEKMEIGREFKCKIEAEEAALDLSLSRKGAKSDTHRRKGKFEEGIGSEAMLVMEVDEIVEQEVKREEEDEDEDAEVPLRQEETAVSFDQLQWEHTPSPPPLPSPSPPSSSPPIDPILTGLLLIDDQGIPYTLTPDGQKVLQAELPKPQKAFTVRPRPKSRQVKIEDSTVIPSPDVVPSNQGLPHTPSCSPSNELPPHPTTSTSTESSVVSKTDLPSGTNSSTATGPLSQPSPSTTAQPVRILANSNTNTPILLLPSAYPSISPSKPISNSSLLALSLPLSIAQKSPSTPVLIVLSPLTTASAPSSSSASASPLAVNDPVTSSLPISQTPSPSSVSLPLSSVQTNPNSLPSTPSLPVLNLDSNTLSTSLGNSNYSTHTSPAVSCATSSNQSNPDHSSEVIFPKRSPRQRLPKPETPSNTKSSSVADTKIKPSNSPLPSSLSPNETPQQPSPPTTPNPLVPPGLKVAPSEASQPASTTDTSKGQFSTRDPYYASSDTPPPAVIFPTNHPKNLSLSPTCPRRILYCQFCPRAFYYLSDLERHSITHSQSKPHVCPLCGKAFKRSSHLERHKHIHTGQRNFVCPICSKRFREAGELLRHQRVHTGEKPFQCPQCHMRFAERNTLRRHAKRKHQDQQGLDGQGDGCHAPGGMQGEQEDSAEWYSSTVPELDSENEMDKE